MTHTTLEIFCAYGRVIYLQDDEGEKIATVHGSCDGSSAVKEERAHRLRLCWNAHDDLLAALEYLVGECDEDMDDDYNPHSAPLIKARAAIAKAAGKP